MNELEKQREQLNRAHNQFRQQHAAGGAPALDRFGRVLKVDDIVMLRTDVDLLYTVVSITPSMNRNGPPGVLNVKLTATFDLAVQAGSPYRMVHVYASKGPVAEDPAANHDDNGQPKTEPAADESRPRLSVVPPIDEPPT